jgi:hypothetical protein
MALLGFVPFAGLLPPTGGTTFPPTRAHMPFVPLRPPRLIFVGVTDRGGNNVIEKAVGPGRCGFDFWAWLPFASDPQRTFGCGSILPWALPLAGLSGTVPCIRQGSTPVRIISLRGVCAGNAAGSQSPIRSWALGVLPGRSIAGRRNAHPNESADLRGCCPAVAPALQRIDGADALPFLRGPRRSRSESDQDQLPV